MIAIRPLSHFLKDGSRLEIMAMFLLEEAGIMCSWLWRLMTTSTFIRRTSGFLPADWAGPLQTWSMVRTTSPWRVPDGTVL